MVIDEDYMPFENTSLLLLLFSLAEILIQPAQGLHIFIGHAQQSAVLGFSIGVGRKCLTLRIQDASLDFRHEIARARMHQGSIVVNNRHKGPDRFGRDGAFYGAVDTSKGCWKKEKEQDQRNHDQTLNDTECSAAYFVGGLERSDLDQFVEEMPNDFQKRDARAQDQNIAGHVKHGRREIEFAMQLRCQPVGIVHGENNAENKSQKS